jgi:DNA-binding beta-propeller fold protein YncE
MGAEGAFDSRERRVQRSERVREAPRRLTLAACLATLALLGTCAAPALAARGHEYAGAFGWGTIDGKAELQRCSTPPPPETPLCQTGLSGDGLGQFNHPAGIAVNETTGEVYVVDKGNNRVEIFNAAGSKLEGEFDGSGMLLSEGQAAGSGGGAEEVPTGTFDEPEGIALDNDPKSPSFGDVYVVDTNGHKSGTFEEERKVIDKYSATGKYIGQITRNPDGEPFSEEGFRDLYGVSVDPRGEVWVEEQNFGETPEGAAHYSNAVANAWIAPFRSTQDPRSRTAAPGFAVDSEGSLYVHNTCCSGDRLAKFDKEGKLITPEADEEAPTDVAVEANSDNVYVAHQENVHRLTSSLESLEVLKAPGSPSFDGVAVNATTLTVYVADPASSAVDVFAPEAPRAPTVEPGSETVRDVGGESASFAAQVNPRSEANEEGTSYAFQLGPCPSAAACASSPYTQSTPAPEGTLAANYEPDPIAAHPQDLSPHTLYHLRVAARNSHGQAFGEELIFTTQGPASPVLPDRRNWELVSPADKHGATLLAIEESGLVQAGANGDALTYLANAPTESQPQGFSQTVQILSRRGGSSWESQDIATPHEATVGISLAGNGEYSYFAEDLESAFVQPVGPFTKAISPQASDSTTYLRSDFPPGDPAHPCSSSCYRPLVSGCPGEGEACPKAIEEGANVPEGTKFGKGNCGELCVPYFLGASADMSHVVLRSAAALSEDAQPAGPEGLWNLYDWSAGKLSLLSVLPSGQALSPKAMPVLGYEDELGTTIGTIGIARQAISTDGSRISFTARELDGKEKPTGNRHLYLRDSASEETVQLDIPEAACTNKGGCKGTANPIFQTASSDGSRIFFTDSQPLTQSSGEADLYECQIEAGEEGLACKLSDLTPLGAGEAEAGVLGLVAGASEDGSSVYFTANGKLGEEANARGEEAVAGDCAGNTKSDSVESKVAPERCNLYERSGGQTKLVAVLSGADFPDFSLRGSQGLNGLTARVSANGRYLAFMSRRSLSGYDNRDAVSGKADQEVFLYDSEANGGAGALVCASCDPSGAQPRGVQFRQLDTNEEGLAGGAGIWPAGAGIAASIPGWTPISGTKGVSLYQSRYLNDSGRLFFNAADSLVAQDSNKTEDVYEYERPGVGDCSEGLATFSPGAGGCVALISSGTAKEESSFLDASESGDDVFFMTTQRLLPNQDVDASRDVYDAHVCSGASPCLSSPPAPLPPCEGDACQSPGAAPEDQTPGSLSFQGPGNPAPQSAPAPKPKSAAQIKAEKLKKALAGCHKMKKPRKRAACEARARKLYGVHKAKAKSKKKSKSKKSSRGRR